MYERLIQKISRERVSNLSKVIPPAPTAENKTVKSSTDIEQSISDQQELLGSERDSINNAVISKTDKIRNISSQLKKNKIKKKESGQKKLVELW